ncbi:hypothetical protein JOM56_002615 [Amanita muscaria]
MDNWNAKINRTCQALRTLTVPLITTTKSFLLTVIFLGLPRYYQRLPPRNLEDVVHQQESRYLSCRSYIGSWKAVRNLSVVASGFLTAILFKMPNDSSPESMKLLLIYPSLVLTTLALTTSTMFIAHFEGETHHDYLDTRHPGSARSIVFAIPATMLVWGVFLALAYTTLSTASQFTNLARSSLPEKRQATIPGT